VEPALLAKYGFLLLLYAFIVAVFLLILRQHFSAPGRVAVQRSQNWRRDSREAEAYLLVQGSSVPEGGLALRKDAPVTIGRSPDCDLVINDQFASGRHATVFFAEGAFRLRDEGSTNGTTVNGERVKGEVALQEGDRITVGITTLTYRQKSIGR